jgi:hypothetical protein
VKDIINSGGSESRRLISLVNKALSVDPLFGQARSDDRWISLGKSIKNLRKNSRDAGLVRETYKFEVTYSGDTEFQDLLDQLQGVLKEDPNVDTSISDNAKYYLLLLGRRSRGTGDSFRGRLRKLCQSASGKTDPEWQVSGTLAGAWVDGLSGSDLDRKLEPFLQTPQLRRALVRLLGQQSDLIFQGIELPGQSEEYPSVDFLARVFGNIFTDKSATPKEKADDLGLFLSISSAQGYYSRFVAKVLKGAQNTHDAIAEAGFLVPSELFWFRQDLREIPILAVTTARNSNFQMVLVPSSQDPSRSSQLCLGDAESKAGKREKTADLARDVILTDTCQRLTKDDVAQWRIFFKTNFFYQEFSEY